PERRGGTPCGACQNAPTAPALPDDSPTRRSRLRPRPAVFGRDRRTEARDPETAGMDPCPRARSVLCPGSCRRRTSDGTSYGAGGSGGRAPVARELAEPESGSTSASKRLDNREDQTRNLSMDLSS